MEKVSFEFLGLALLEPLSFAANCIMAIQCIYYVNQLDAKNKYSTSWRWFFLFYGGSFIFGGLSHLLFNYTGLMGKIPGWSCAIIGITLAEWAFTYRYHRVIWKVSIRRVLILKLMLTISLMIYDFKFLWVMVHTTGLLFFVGIPAFTYWRKEQKGYQFFLIGLCALMVTAPVKILKVDIHPMYFNRDDISHVFMIVAIWLFYKAIKATGLE